MSSTFRGLPLFANVYRDRGRHPEGFKFFVSLNIASRSGTSKYAFVVSVNIAFRSTASKYALMNPPSLYVVQIPLDFS